MKKGFTLLELIVVIIIVGVLATLGFVQYTKVIEKGRKAEARANLGTLRQLQVIRFQETGAYTDLAGLATGLPAACAGQTTHYFQYSCVAASGNCTADRCGTGTGKNPGVAAVDDYTITLDPAGTFSGTGDWQ